MNVDRLPDGRDDDPERAIETPRLTESTGPETPPPPDNASRAEPSPEASQPKEDAQATENPRSTENVVRAHDSPDDQDTAAPPPDPAETRETAEPRSRQEHADLPRADEGAGAIDAGVEDRNAGTTTESADEVPGSAVVIGEATDDEITTVFARDDATESPMSDRGPSQEEGTGEEEGAEELPGRKIRRVATWKIQDLPMRYRQATMSPPKTTGSRHSATRNGPNTSPKSVTA